MLASAQEIIVCCGNCAGVICRAVEVYEAGCGFPHVDVDPQPCSECNGVPLALVKGRGDRIRTDYWRKPGPTNQFDWSACFEDDEPNDNGSMLAGYGATESAAIEDLLRLVAEEAE